MPSRNVTLQAVWNEIPGPVPPVPEKVTVTFCVDDKEYDRITIDKGTSLNDQMPDDPTKQYYDFTGWYTADGEEFTEETIVNQNITVNAKFELNENYVIVTYVIDGEIYLTEIVEKDHITPPDVPSEDNKELNGWYSDEDLQNKFDFESTVVVSSLTLYAVWEGDSFNWLWLLLLLAAIILLIIAALAKKVRFYDSRSAEEEFKSKIIFGSKLKQELLDEAQAQLLSMKGTASFSGWYNEEGELLTGESKAVRKMKIFAEKKMQ